MVKFSWSALMNKSIERPRCSVWIAFHDENDTYMDRLGEANSHHCQLPPAGAEPNSAWSNSFGNLGMSHGGPVERTNDV